LKKLPREASGPVKHPQKLLIRLKASMQRPFGNSPLERGAFSIVEMKKAGCVKMRTPAIAWP
jgi:hypothetical protein